MSQPVTTNPLIIMLINMTVVFLVLMALGVVITKAAPKEEAPAAPAPVAEPEPIAAAPVEEGISPEVVAVIAAAVASMGYGADSVRAIRPLERNNWKNSGRQAIQSRG